MKQIEAHPTPSGQPADRAALMQQAAAACARGEREAALDIYRLVVATFPAFHPATVRIASLLGEMGRFDEADAEIDLVLKEEPANQDALMARAAIARLRGDREAALRHYRDVARSYPDSDSPVIEATVLLRELGRLDEADAEIDGLLQRRPDHTGALLHRGHTAEARQFGSGRAWFERALATAPGTPWPYICLARCLAKLGEEAAACALLADACNRFPHDPPIIQAAVLLRELCRLDEAAAAVEGLLQRQPDNPDALREHGNIAARHALILAEGGRFDEADAEIDRVLGQEPANQVALMGRAAIARQRGDREAALKHYRHVARSYPDSDTPVIEATALLRELGRLDEADLEIDGLLQRRPDHPNGLLHRGHTAEARQVGSGRAWFERAIATGPGRPWPYTCLADCLVRLGDDDAARTLLADARDRFPQYAQFALRCAVLDWSHGQLDDAFVQIEALANRFPRDFDVWRQHIDWAMLLGRFDEAARLLDAAVAPDLVARWASAALRAALASRQMDFVAARPYLREILTLPPVTASDHQALAQNLLYTLDLDEARDQLEAAARLRLAAQGTSAEDNARVAVNIRNNWLKEFSVNPFAVQQLRSALALPIARQAPAFAEILREEPNHTPTAILLMIQLRRSGYFQTLREASGTAAAWPAAIPRRVLQFWDTTEVPADVATLMASWPRVCADFEYTRFDEPRARRFLQTHYEPAVLRAFQKCETIPMKADLFRLAFLFLEGGVYADADDCCRHPISALGRPDADLILYQEEHGSLGVNFIAAAPGHPVLGDALDHAVKEILESSRSDIFFTTGPGQMTRAAARQLRPRLRTSGSATGPLPRWIILDRCELLSCVSVRIPRFCHNTQKS